MTVLDDITEIIGRDINWEDCSLAIEKKVTDKDEYIMTVYNEFQLINTDTGEYIKTIFEWKPTLPLHLQDPPTIDFLVELLVKEKNDD